MILILRRFFDSFNRSTVWKWLLEWIPARASVLQSLRVFAMVLAGGILLTPVTHRLPMAGWDWYYFFNAGNPAYNLYSLRSAYPPFARPVLQLLTWMDWRDSLALLHGITLAALALGTWKAGGRYGSIFLTLFSPPVLMLLWIGHPDGLAFLGVVTGFVPLTLLKPQITAWSLLSNRKLLFWAAVFILITSIIWPLWFMALGQATLTHEAAFGWVVTGWPVALLGLAMLAGAGRDPYRLMAAGALLSPYLMPYHLAVLTPAIGQVKGYRKMLLWFSSCLLLLGVGLSGPFIYLNLVFPIMVYVLNHSAHGYITCLGGLIRTVQVTALSKLKWSRI